MSAADGTRKTGAASAGAANLLRTLPVQGWIVAFGLLVYAAVWLTHLTWASLSPPSDNIEQLNWVNSLEWGYYKHPPLPTWLLWLPVRLFGASAATTYLAGAACTLGALGIFWRLLARLRGPVYANVALLAALCITFYNGRLYYYNHNVVLMLASTACAAFTQLAFETRRLRWWAAIGVALGLGALAKYQIAVTLASLLAFWLHQRGWGDPLHRRGLLLAALLGLALLAPHLAWLPAHDFGPIGYAMQSSLGARLGAGVRVADTANWLADLLLNRALPAWIVLGFAAAWRAGPATSSDAARVRRVGDAGRALLLCWGLVPIGFMALLGLASGAEMQLQWGTPFVLFAVPVAMELAPAAWSRAALLHRAWRAFLVVQLLLLAISHVTSPLGWERWRDRHWRTFDSAALRDDVGVPARAALGVPVRVIIGPGPIAGALSLQLPEHPLVLIDGRYDISPWVGRDLVDRCGALELWTEPVRRGGRPAGPDFPGLFWRVVAPRPGGGGCPH